MQANEKGKHKEKYWTIVTIDLSWEFQPKSIDMFIHRQKEASINKNMRPYPKT